MAQQSGVHPSPGSPQRPVGLGERVFQAKTQSRKAQGHPRGLLTGSPACPAPSGPSPPSRP